MEKPLAIEGYKRFEAAQQELFDAFSACYKKVNGRAVESFQPHEMTMFCSDTCFFDLIESIRVEIEHVSGEPTTPVKHLEDVVTLANDRSVFIEDGATVDTMADPLHRTELLGELLADLQACRMLNHKMCITELTLEFSNTVDDAKLLISEMGASTGTAVPFAKSGVYVGKGTRPCKGDGGAMMAGNEMASSLQRIAEAIRSDTMLSRRWSEYLLYPEWKMSHEQESMVDKVIAVLNEEYSIRRKIFSRRLDVTIQAFLWSSKADRYRDKFASAIAAVMDWKDKLGAAAISKWSMYAADQNALIDNRVSFAFNVPSPVKAIVIGAVPDRGGVPEGYTVEDIAKDIVKANVALTKKDQAPGAKGGSAAQVAAAFASKRWLGEGMGSSWDGLEGGTQSVRGGAQPSSGGKGGGHTERNDSRGVKGGKRDGDNEWRGGRSYGGREGKSGDSGGRSGSGGGGGGFYGNVVKCGSERAVDGGERSQCKGGGGRGKSGGDQGRGGGTVDAWQVSGGGSGSGGYYAQKSGGRGDCSGGFYSSSQHTSGSGGFYSSKGGGGEFGVGGFYAQQRGVQELGVKGGAGGNFAKGGGSARSGEGGYQATKGGSTGSGGWGGRSGDLPPTAMGWTARKR
eukprot:TRINITY_DN54664_c0_g1_i1.p1 TRINITY_DN54664_c0_g1~~TRINITY_DN54664_c0_g1_i1.p1  ORF type:complete len:626 (+),score=112.79 TRINITY_DN54664_c0_g1_i1:116-1993(+)